MIATAIDNPLIISIMTPVVIVPLMLFTGMFV